MTAAITVTTASAAAVLGVLTLIIGLLAKAWPILRKVQRVHDDVLGDTTAPAGDPRREPLRHVVASIGAQAEAAKKAAEETRAENKAQHGAVSKKLDDLAEKVNDLAAQRVPRSVAPATQARKPRTQRKAGAA